MAEISTRAVRAVTDRQTDKPTTVTLLRMRRGLIIAKVDTNGISMILQCHVFQRFLTCGLCQDCFFFLIMASLIAASPIVYIVQAFYYLIPTHVLSGSKSVYLSVCMLLNAQFLFLV